MKVAPPKGTTTSSIPSTWGNDAIIISKTSKGRRRLAWTQTHTSVPTCEAGHKCTEFGGECNTLAFPRYCDLETGLCRKDYNVSRPGTPVRQCMTSNTATKSPVIFDPQETTCTKIPYREDQKDITKMKVAAPRTATCTTTIKDNGQTQAETETNPIAELCAEYLFNFRDGTVDNAQLCCRHDDLELLRLVQTTIQGFTIQFGQCDNCLKTVKKQLCQMACDQDNSRFYLVRSNNSEPVVQAVCPEYCENIFLACKAVKWHDTIGFLFDTSTEFCKQVLNLEVIELPEPDQERRSDRICIAGVSVEPDIHCLGKQVHSSLGLTTTLLCGFIVVASVCAEIVEGLPCNVISIIPPATITLCVGMAFGALIKHAIAPSEEERDGTHHVLDFTSFDVELFIFLLLPVIIFSSAFNMDKPSVVFLVMKLKRTTMFAVFGTLIALFFNGACIWALNEKLGMLKHSLSLPEAMMFGSLISAVDPVATLAAFSTIGVDPRLYALIYGESILNDAVAIVAFRVWQTVSEQTSNPSMGSTLANAGLTFLTIGVGSLALGMLFGALVLLLFRFHGENPAHDLAEALVAHSKAKANQTDVDATEAKVAELHAHKHNHRSDHKAMLEASCFFFASLSSYYAAEALHISGIISALVCGLICNQWAVKMLSERAHDHAKRFYVTLSEICDSLIMLWVGLLFYLALDDMPWKFAVISLGLVMLSRAISVFGVAAGINAFASEGAGLPFKQQLMMFGGGLRTFCCACVQA
jgi:NhaP-type Na+/H+ or K+/H+ antiporter